MHIRCTNGSPIVDMLNHLPPLQLFLEYYGHPLTEQDESGLYHALQLRDRVYRIDLSLPPSILHKVFVLLDGQFPILEHLSLKFSATSKNSPPLTLPKAFLAPTLRHLDLPSISPPRRLRVLTSTDTLVTLELNNIKTSSYFRPRLLVARLLYLPLLEGLSIGFSIPIPRPSRERELLGEQGAPVTLPSLKTLQFKGVGAYLESLVAQIRAPLLEQLSITLFNRITFALPHLSHLINITEVFKIPSAAVGFDHNEVDVTMLGSKSASLVFRVMCQPMDWKIDCATQICHTFIPEISSVEQLTLHHEYRKIPTEWRNRTIDSAMWHDLLRSFIGLKELSVGNGLLEELSHALQVDGVGSDPGFLPNLQFIKAEHNLFASFIDARQVVGRLVQFSYW